jgi:disulfide oxidoreductase YuzD
MRKVTNLGNISMATICHSCLSFFTCLQLAYWNFSATQSRKTKTQTFNLKYKTQLDITFRPSCKKIHKVQANKILFELILLCPYCMPFSCVISHVIGNFECKFIVAFTLQNCKQIGRRYYLDISKHLLTTSFVLYSYIMRTKLGFNYSKITFHWSTKIL